jgi:hypothetical protein
MLVPFDVYATPSVSGTVADEAADGGAEEFAYVFGHSGS